MRAERHACRAAAAGFCVLLTASAPALAQPDHTLFLPVIYAELSGSN